MSSYLNNSIDQYQIVTCNNFSTLPQYIMLTHHTILQTFYDLLEIIALSTLQGCAVAKVSPPAFAVLFSIGVIAAVVRCVLGYCSVVDCMLYYSFILSLSLSLSLSSTFFLMGPVAQAKKIIDYKNTIEFIVRIIALVVIAIAIVLAIVCGALVNIDEEMCSQIDK